MSPGVQRLAVAAGVLLLAGCSGEPEAVPASPSSGWTGADATAVACQAAVERLVTTTQAYVDTYGNAVAASPSANPSASPSANPSANPSVSPSASPSADPRAGLRTTIEGVRSQLDRLQCAPGPLHDQLRTGLARVSARGALAQAVRTRLVASMTGAVAVAAETRRVGPGDDLAAILPTLAPGSTVLFSDRPRGRIDGVTCAGDKMGIVIGKSALPFLGAHSCTVQPVR